MGFLGGLVVVCTSPGFLFSLLHLLCFPRDVMICVRSRASGCPDHRAVSSRRCVAVGNLRGLGGIIALLMGGREIPRPVAVFQVQHPTNLCSSSIHILLGQTKENSPLSNCILGVSLSPSSDYLANCHVRIRLIS
jgi:hypothetical protein